jgi:thermostable 8-oxoguanine DNA glycosylase
VVKHIEDSLAFNKFQRDGNLNAVTEFDLCDLLYCTVESTAETLENNLGVLVSNVKNFQREDLVPFLNNLRHRFPKRFA